MTLDTDAMDTAFGDPADWWHAGDADDWGGSGLWFPDDTPDDGGDDGES